MSILYSLYSVSYDQSTAVRGDTPNVSDDWASRVGPPWRSKVGLWVYCRHCTQQEVGGWLSSSPLHKLHDDRRRSRGVVINMAQWQAGIATYSNGRVQKGLKSSWLTVWQATLSETKVHLAESKNKAAELEVVALCIPQVPHFCSVTSLHFRDVRCPRLTAKEPGERETTKECRRATAGRVEGDAWLKKHESSDFNQRLCWRYARPMRLRKRKERGRKSVKWRESCNCVWGESSNGLCVCVGGKLERE